MFFCTCYSETHKPFLNDFFLKTFPLEDDVSLIIEKLSQRCSSGNLFSKGWRDQMIDKQIFINKWLNLIPENEIVVFSDVDVSFYDDIKDDLVECLGDRDICFLKDHNSNVGRCGGFFVLKNNNKMRSFFAEVLEKLSSYQEEAVTFETSEQSTINNLFIKRHDVSWEYLPPRYYTHGLYIQGIKNFSDENQSGLWWENKDWEEKNNTLVVDDILVHHANWCHGIKNKLHLLKWVESLVRARE